MNLGMFRHSTRPAGSASRILTTGALVIAAVFLVAIPSVYFALRYQFEMGLLQAEATMRLQSFLADSGARPSGYRLDEALLHAGLTRKPDKGGGAERSAVLDRHGRLLVESGPYSSLDGPVIAVSTPWRDPSGFIGQYRMERSIRGALLDSLKVLTGAALLCAITLISFSQFPLRALRRAEADLHFQADHDALTGLPNRSAFRRRLVEAKSRADHAASPLAVMFLDLDDFKAVNDTMGHAGGDALLRDAAARIRAAVRVGDVAARLGGDEFAIVLENVGSPEDAARVSTALLEKFKEPFSISGRRHDLSCSIGISMYPMDHGDPDQLLGFANIALHECKRAGRSNFVFYSPSMQAQIEKKLRLQFDLRQAWENKQFVMHYQPLCDTRFGHLVGVEALIRWESPERGLVPPGEFVGSLEQTGLIEAVGGWAILEACREARAWKRGRTPLVISVNVSPRQFRRGEALVASVRTALSETGLAPGRLLIEITEGMLMEHREESLLTLNQLKALGVSIAVDDFGTGYSSLAYLKHFPVDTLKIDRSFVDALSEDTADANIVLAIVQLARGLKLSVTAEGVETQQQLDLLRRYGCDTVQGYALGKPVPATQFESEMLNSDRWMDTTVRMFALQISGPRRHSIGDQFATPDAGSA